MNKIPLVEPFSQKGVKLKQDKTTSGTFDKSHKDCEFKSNTRIIFRYTVGGNDTRVCVVIYIWPQCWSSLRENPVHPLHILWVQHFEISKGDELKRQNQVALNPLLCLHRPHEELNVKQENLKIFSRPQNDGTDKLEFDSIRRKKYKPGSTARKILVLINYKRLRQKPEA